MSEYVTSGAIMTCACGAAPSQLEVTSNTFYFIQGKLAATTADNVPMVNIRPFGTCTMKPTVGGFLPCIPAPTMWSGFVDSVRVGRGFPLLNTSAIQCAMGGLISFQNSGQMKPDKARVNPNSPQIDALLRAAKEAKPFCEICEYVEEEKKNPQILRMYCVDEQEQERIELNDLEEGREVTLCIEVEEGGAGEKIDVEIQAPQGQRFKDGTNSMKFTDLEVEFDNTAYVDNFSYELKND